MCHLGRTIVSPNWERTETEKKVCKVLEEVAAQVGAKSIQAVAIAYVMQKTPYVFPILGGRKPEQLYANIEALDIALTEEHIRYIESAVPFDIGFPCNMLVSGCLFRETTQDIDRGCICDRATAPTTRSCSRTRATSTSGPPPRPFARLLRFLRAAKLHVCLR